MKPTNLITTAFAKALSQNYIISRENSPNFNQDATSVWFSIEEMELYLAYLKTESQEKNYEINGIRFYFGVYPTDFIDPEKAGMTTLFVCPTTNKATEPQSFDFEDVVEISAMNYGSFTKPPKGCYPKKK